MSSWVAGLSSAVLQRPSYSRSAGKKAAGLPYSLEEGPALDGPTNLSLV